MESSAKRLSKRHRMSIRCVNLDSEFEQRTKTRQQEMKAVTKALQFLNSDEAHDLFSRTSDPGMMNEIINEAKALQTEATLSVDDQQTGYETLVKDTNESLDKKNKDLTNKSDVLAKTQAALPGASVFEATSGGTSATSARCLARSTP